MKKLLMSNLRKKDREVFNEALKEAKEQKRLCLNKSKTGFVKGTCLIHAFYWMDTEKGADYWLNIDNKYEEEVSNG